MEDTLENKEISIMGSIWKIYWLDSDEFSNAYGLTDEFSKTIEIQRTKPDDMTVLQWYENQCRVLRHEIIHAFLIECGLSASSNACDAWAENEEMIDWFARLSTKIFDVYNELKII